MIAWFLRGAAGGQAIEILREERDVLAKRVTELETTNTSLTKRVTELEAKKDVALAITPALSPLADMVRAYELADVDRHKETVSAFAAIVEELKAFDNRSERRAERITAEAEKATQKLITVMEMIADRLGPEEA